MPTTKHCHFFSMLWSAAILYADRWPLSQSIDDFRGFIYVHPRPTPIHIMYRRQYVQNT